MKYYPLAESLSIEECATLGVDTNKRIYLASLGCFMGGEGKTKIMAVSVGEKRPPKKGEWYLSGAKVGAYRAPNDFGPGMEYHIARLVKVQTMTQTIVKEV